MEIRLKKTTIAAMGFLALLSGCIDRSLDVNDPDYPIDGYSILHPDGRRLAVLYLSPYHKRNSEKAPRGFTLLKTTIG